MKSKDLVVEVKALTDGNGVDLVLDAVGGPLFEPCSRSLRIGGRHVAITSVGNGRVEFNLVDFYHNLLRLIGVDTLKLTGTQIAKIMDVLRPGFESGQLRPSPVHTWPLNQGVDAYAAVQKGEASSKQVLLPKSA